MIFIINFALIAVGRFFSHIISEAGINRLDIQTSFLRTANIFRTFGHQHIVIELLNKSFSVLVVGCALISGLLIGSTEMNSCSCMTAGEYTHMIFFSLYFRFLLPRIFGRIVFGSRFGSLMHMPFFTGSRCFYSITSLNRDGPRLLKKQNKKRTICLRCISFALISSYVLGSKIHG